MHIYDQENTYLSSMLNIFVYIETQKKTQQNIYCSVFVKDGSMFLNICQTLLNIRQ